MGKIRGIDVTLYEKTRTGTDSFNRPVYTETPVTVSNVLVGEPSESEITDTTNLTGKRLLYILGIPKGDTHVWTDRRVSFFGEDFQTVGEVTQGIEDMIPLDWNKKVRVVRYE